LVNTVAVIGAGVIGGATIEGIYEIEDGKLRTALMNAVQAATNKCLNIRHLWENNA